MNVARFRELLEAYGAASERWPDAEREAAEQLLDVSAEARVLREAAADLDLLLDTVPPPPLPSRDLAGRVMASAPKPRVVPLPKRRALAVSIPLAAAAAVTLWLATREQPSTSAPPADLAAIEVIEYTSPTDVLLGAYGVDVYTVAPSVGCADSVLGCPNMEDAEQSESRLPAQSRPMV